MRVKINNLASAVVAGPAQLPGAAAAVIGAVNDAPDLNSTVETLSGAMIELTLHPNLEHDGNVIRYF